MPINTCNRIFQVMVLVGRPALNSYRAIELYYEKPIPSMHDRNDALELAKFINFPTMVIVRHDTDTDTGRRIEGSQVIVDLIGVDEDTDTTPYIGGMNARDLRVWKFPVTDLVEFPNAKVS